MTGSELLEALPVAVYTTDAKGRITFYNEAAADLWGHRPTLGSDQWCGSWRLYWPDGRPLPHDECPMAVTLKEGRPIRGVEAVAERPDGTRVSFLPYPTPLRDASGRLIGAINLLVDLTDRLQGEFERARLASLVASSDDAIISKTLDGRITSWNAGATHIFGYGESEMIGQPIYRLIPPELHHEETEILEKLARGEQIQHYETKRVTKDGRRIDISLSVSPLRDKSGKVIGASKIARDITERAEAERLRRLLLEELNHRVKNTLATVQAIANQSLRRTKNPSDFVPRFTGRIQALARAHALLAHTASTGAELKDLVQDQILFGAVEDDRVSCSGPLLKLDSHVALHLALVLHELGTNARKYGALSVATGQVSISWGVRTNGGRSLLLEWKESGGPRVSAPSARGFGSTLIEQTLQTCGGEASIQYDATGVSCAIRLPIPDTAQPQAGMYAAGLMARTGIRLLEQPTKQSTLGGKRIIVVEDEPLLSMDIEASLREADCEVIGPVGTLEQAKLLIAEGNCDAVLLDANLGGHPVDELAASLTQKNVPFAFVTGYGREGLPQGFRDAIMLDKPFSRDQLLAIIELLLYPGDGVTRLKQKKS